MTWAQQFRKARGSLTQEGAAAVLSGPDAVSRCPVATVRDWEQGRHAPTGWQQYMIVAQLMRQQIAPKKQARLRKGSNS